MPWHRLTVSYRGTAYGGWQRQENALAVQQVLEEALGAAHRRARAHRRLGTHRRRCARSRSGGLVRDGARLAGRGAGARHQPPPAGGRAGARSDDGPGRLRRAAPRRGEGVSLPPGRDPGAVAPRCGDGGAAGAAARSGATARRHRGAARPARLLRLCQAAAALTVDSHRRIVRRRVAAVGPCG